MILTRTDDYTFEKYIKRLILEAVSPKYKNLVDVHLVHNPTFAGAEVRVSIPSLENPITTTISYNDLSTIYQNSFSSVSYTIALKLVTDLSEKLKHQIETTEKSKEFWAFIEKGPKSVK